MRQKKCTWVEGERNQGAVWRHSFLQTKKLLKRNHGVSFGETGRKISEKMIRKLSGCYTFDKELEPRIVGNEKIGRKSVGR